MIRVDRVDCFKHIIERIQKMINGWMERTLSYGGKEALFKAVAQAIPTYAMSVFKFPEKIARGSQMLFRTTGGVTGKTNVRCIGSLGGRCAFLRKEGAWGFVMSIALIWHS